MTTTPPPVVRRRPRSWPVLLLAAPAFVAIWSGWVGLGGLTGFGMVTPFPGIWDHFTLNSAITLPIGVETYAAYALHVWLSRTVEARAARFAKWSALGSLVLGAAGQVAYHLMVAAGMTHAPWQITAVVASLPVAVLGMGAALAHLVQETLTPQADSDTPTGEAAPPAVQDQPGTTDTLPTSPATADEAPAAVPAPAPVPEIEPAPRPAPRLPRPTAAPVARPGGRPAGSSTTATVTRLRAKHPDWTLAQIAEKAGCSVRTARRHLNATGPADGSQTEGAAA